MENRDGMSHDLMDYKGKFLAYPKKRKKIYFNKVKLTI